MPPIKMRGDGRKAKNPKQTFTRLLSYLLPYKINLIGMALCTVLATVASVLSNTSVGTLIGKYVEPLLGQRDPDFGPMVRFLCVMACVYLAGLFLPAAADGKCGSRHPEEYSGPAVYPHAKAADPLF